MKQPPKGTEEYRTYKRNLEYIYANTEHGFLTRLFQSIFTRAKERKTNGTRKRCKGWEPEITKKQLWQLYHEQTKIYGKICLYCNQALTFNRRKREKNLTEERIQQIRTNISIDRYDPDQTYKPGNIAFCCWDCNLKKNSSNIKNWVNFLKGRKKIIK